MSSHLSTQSLHTCFSSTIHSNRRCMGVQSTAHHLARSETLHKLSVKALQLCSHSGMLALHVGILMHNDTSGVFECALTIFCLGLGASMILVGELEMGLPTSLWVLFGLWVLESYVFCSSSCSPPSFKRPGPRSPDAIS